MHRPISRAVCALLGVTSLTLAGTVVPIAVTAQEPVGDLILSEYVEGSSTNKAVEIFNGTQAPVDLSAHSVELYSNGATDPTAMFALEGTLPAGQTYVLASTSLADYADQTTGSGLWNGDDAIVLRGPGGVVDSFGRVGEDPGEAWTSGDVSTRDTTLRRSAATCAGDTVVDDAFDPAAQWVAFPQDTFDGLGAHDTDCSGGGAPDGPVLNEFSASTAGTDVEFLEVFGPAATDYGDLTVLQVEGDGDSSSLGTVVSSVPVGTTDAAGFWAQDLPANSLQNGTLTLLLVSGFSEQVVLDADQDGVLDDDIGLQVVDSVSVDDGDAGDLVYSPAVLRPGYDGLEFAPGGASRIPDGTDTDSPGDWVRNVFEPDGTPGPGEAFNTPGEPNAVPEPEEPPVQDCGDPVSAIGAVQGEGSATPVGGQDVSVEGVVVGDFQDGGFDGFYVQDGGDDNLATSDGIFVYAPAGTAVAEGDRVRVSGTAGEFFDLTQISSAVVQVCAADAALPVPVEVTLPDPDLEPTEGMRVTLPQSLAILEYFNYGRFGEIALGTDRQFQPTAIFDPGSAEAQALLEANRSSRITLDDGRSVQNPDPAIHPNGSEFTLENSFRGGDLVTDATGVLDFRFELWRVQPTQGADVTVANPRPDVPEVGGSTTVASFNVLNYFTTLGSRGADTEEEFERQEAKIVSALAAMDADVFGLIEIENNGTAVAVLVEALNAEVGAGTFDYVDTGVVGTDEITTALIYQPAEVEPTGDFATLTSEDDPRFLDSKNRPALAQTFTDLETGGAVTVAVNHLKSKGSSCEDVGDPTDPNGQGNCNGVRTDAARALADWLAGDPTGTGVEDALVIGDLNSYDKEDPIVALQEAGWTDLLLAEQGERAYSYVFDGQLGYLDYAMANPGLLDRVTGADVWRINADEPGLIDYDTTFKKPAQDALYAPDPYRSSDHDPVVVGLDLAPVERVTDRIDGEDRYETAANVARELGPVQTVYVASGEVFPDALAASPAAIGADAALLLTTSGDLPDPTVAVLDELSPEQVVVLGGTLRIEPSVLAELGALTGAPVTRIAGTNRYDTAAQIAATWDPAEIDTVYLASGEEFADALAAGPLAGLGNDPILLTQEDALSPETAQALAGLEADEIVILGGEERIADAVYLAALEYAPEVTRLAGTDRYVTASLIAERLPDAGTAYLASGAVFVDALSGSVLAGRTGSPLLLTRPERLVGVTAQTLLDRDPVTVTLLGGTRALAPEVADGVRALWP